ncbi:ABC transporter substrate-binding protein [Cohnella cellulosilytica]|uniref:ABC transporter substrate-binding protein n=1 Tax=Cohnella cellulosilytica TaxID=986710 RepID=A0ABW2F7X7_9BACL
MKFRKLAAAAGSVLLVSGLLAACGSGGSGTANSGTTNSEASKPAASSEGAKETVKENVTLRFSWWGGDSRHKATLEALDKYMELHPNVKVEAEYGGFDGYEQKLKTQLAGQTAPDLIQVDQPWLYDLSAQGEMFADLSGMGDRIDTSTFDAKFLADYSTIDGKLLGLPTGLNGTIMFYNKDLFGKYGIPEDVRFDWDNLLTYGEKVYAESGGEDYLLNIAPEWVAELARIYITQKTGSQFIGEDYALGFDAVLAEEAYAYIQKLLDAHVIQPFSESSLYINKEETNPKWLQGHLGMTISYPSVIPAASNGVAFEVGVLPIVIAKDAKNTASEVRPSQIYAIARSSQHPEEAAELMNWLLNDPEAAALLGDARGTPASSAAVEALKAAGKLDPLIAEGTEIAVEQSGGPVNGIVRNAELATIRTDLVEQLGYGKLTAAEAAEQTVAKLGKKLEELKASQ